MSRYGAESGDLRRAALTFIWVVLADALLKFFARCAGCVEPLHLDGREFARIYDAAALGCQSEAVFDSPLVLNFAAREGAIFGLGAPAVVGPIGQLYGLAALALAAIVSVLLLRWQWRAVGDPRIVGVLAAGAWIEALPRFLNGGLGITELELFGVGMHLGDLALALGVLWALSRALGEWRA